MAIQPETVVIAQWMIGETYFHQNDYARARQAYKKVLIDRNAADWQARAALQMGKCWELEGEWKKAENSYIGAIDQWPDTIHKPEMLARLRWARQQNRSFLR